jgi:hypothetical protein
LLFGVQQLGRLRSSDIVEDGVQIKNRGIRDGNTYWKGVRDNRELKMLFETSLRNGYPGDRGLARGKEGLVRGK